MMDRIEVKTKAAAVKAINDGKPIRIVSGRFALDLASLTGVDIQIAAQAEIELTLTNVIATVSQEDMRSSRVVARGSSRVEAWESSRVEARESSRVVARESSRVVARGYSMLQARSNRASLRASATVCVNLWNGATCEGGRQQIVTLSTAQDWCEYYGVRVEDGHAIVYKAVGEDYMSQWGVRYAPGAMPVDAKWDGKKRECAAGGGLNFSPTPRHTHEFVPSPKHYLECRIALSDMSIHWDGRYPQKVCAPAVVAPLVEVDVDGNPIAVAVAELLSEEAARG